MHFLTWLILDQDMYWSGNPRRTSRKRPFITIGFTALLLLIPLAVTSTNGMMRRLGQAWKTLHRLIYLIALLGVGHYWWQVKADIREPLIYLAIRRAAGWRMEEASARKTNRSAVRRQSESSNQ